MTGLAAASLADVLRASLRFPAPQQNAWQTLSVREATIASRLILINRLIDCFIDWLIGWRIDWLIDWSIYWLNNWLIDWLIDCLIDWLIDRLIDRSIDPSIDWLFHWLVEWWFIRRFWTPFPTFLPFGGALRGLDFLIFFSFHFSFREMVLPVKKVLWLSGKTKNFKIITCAVKCRSKIFVHLETYCFGNLVCSPVVERLNQALKAFE